MEPEESLLGEKLEGAISVNVSGQVSIADLVNSGITLVLPHIFERNLIHVPAVKVFCTLLDPVDVWKSGYTRKAIDLAIFQLTEPADEIWPDVEYPYVMHPAFEATTRILDTDTKIRMALRACAEALTNGNMRDEHRLRKGAGANAEPVTRKSDQATAWRRDIDHELHLHYWRSATSIELAVVVPHNDFRFQNKVS